MTCLYDSLLVLIMLHVCLLTWSFLILRSNYCCCKLFNSNWTMSKKKPCYVICWEWEKILGLSLIARPWHGKWSLELPKIKGDSRPWSHSDGKHKKLKESPEKKMNTKKYRGLVHANENKAQAEWWIHLMRIKNKF